jgi:hypothetical protein
MFFRRIFCIMTIKIMNNKREPIVIPAIAPGDSLSLGVVDPPTGANVGDGLVVDPPTGANVGDGLVVDPPTGANVGGGIGGLILVIE